MVTSFDYWDEFWLNSSDDARESVEGSEISPLLDKFWNEVSKRYGGGRLLDVACGAGGALRRLIHRFDTAVGLDLSPSAASKVSGLADGRPLGLVASAAAIPIRDASFELVVSQFGLEYASFHVGLKEAVRVAAIGGSIVVIAHMKGGAIDLASARRLSDVNMFKMYLDAAVPFFETGLAAERETSADRQRLLQRANDAAAEFKPVSDRVAALARRNNRTAEVLQSNVIELHRRRRGLSSAAITHWLADARQRLDLYEARLSAMRKSALSEDEIRESTSTIKNPKPIEIKVARMTDSSKNPFAWSVEMQKY